MKLGFTPCEQPPWGMELQRKRSTKRLKHTGNLLWKNLKKSVNSRLKAIYIIGQRKAFYRQRIPESRKETVDIDILVIFRNGVRKIMQSIRIISRPPLKIKKWNLMGRFRLISTKVILIEKTKTGYISTVSQGPKRSSKWRTSSPTYPFLKLVRFYLFFFK